MSEIVCPICGNNHLMRKVSAIVGAGSYRGHSSGMGTAYDLSGDAAITFNESDTHMTSNLATKLAPPPMPMLSAKDDLSALPYALGCLFVVFLLIAIGVSSMMFGLFSLIIGIVIVWGINKQSSQKKEVESRIPRWQEAMNRWDRLYYCLRDDLVIDPMTGKSAPAGRLGQILYD